MVKGGRSEKYRSANIPLLILFKLNTTTAAEMRRHSLSWRLSIVRRDGTSPWDLPQGLNTHRPPWTSSDGLRDPGTHPLSLFLFALLSHALMKRPLIPNRQY